MVTAYSRNETSEPAVRSPLSTIRPPCHSTAVTPPKVVS